MRRPHTAEIRECKCQNTVGERPAAAARTDILASQRFFKLNITKPPLILTLFISL
jgi:hypothetical protein